MKKRKYMTPSTAVATKLDGLLSVFTKAVSDLKSLAEEAKQAINCQEAIIAKAQAEKDNIEETLAKIGRIEQNLSNLIEPSV